MNHYLLEDNKNLRLRTVKQEDCELLFQWRNLPEIILLSGSQKSVSWHEHIIWFEKMICDSEVFLLIISEKNHAIGQIRFERMDINKAEVGIYLTPTSVGKGFGAFLISQASGIVKQKWPNLQTIVAKIRQDNFRSIRAFESAGFKLDQFIDLRKDTRFHRMNLKLDNLK